MKALCMSYVRPLCVTVAGLSLWGTWAKPHTKTHTVTHTLTLSLSPSLFHTPAIGGSPVTRLGDRGKMLTGSVHFLTHRTQPKAYTYAQMDICAWKKCIHTCIHRQKGWNVPVTCRKTHAGVCAYLHTYLHTQCKVKEKNNNIVTYVNHTNECGVDLEYTKKKKH